MVVDLAGEFRVTATTTAMITSAAAAMMPVSFQCRGNERTRPDRHDHAGVWTGEAVGAGSVGRAGSAGGAGSVGSAGSVGGAGSASGAFWWGSTVSDGASGASRR